MYVSKFFIVVLLCCLNYWHRWTNVWDSLLVLWCHCGDDAFSVSDCTCWKPW